MTNQLVCPKCRGNMATYERNGVHVDQCQECRGLFLDRGELERLIDAEAQWSNRPAPAAQTVAPQAFPQQGNYQSGYSQPHNKKRKSFLEELFD